MHEFKQNTVKINKKNKNLSYNTTGVSKNYLILINSQNLFYQIIFMIKF